MGGNRIFILEQSHQLEKTSIRRILVLTTSYPNSSDDWSGVFIHKLNVALAARDYEIVVLAPSNGEYYGLNKFDGITVIRFAYFWPRKMERLCSGAGGIPENLNKTWLAKVQLITMTVVFFFESLRKSGNADVIYANWLGAGLVGALAGLIRKLPLITSFRGDDGYLAKERLLWRIVSKFVIARSSALAPVSRQLAEICEELGAEKRKVFTPGFGVDTGMFCPVRKSYYETGPVRIVFAGSLIPKKGVQDLLRALSSSEFNNTVLDVVGEGFLADDLKKLAQECNISYRINWLGLATPKQVAEIMQYSDILCLPSHTEGSPNVVKEAMSCGLPVVATRVGGVPDLVTDGVTGFLFEIGNIDQMRGKLTLLIQDPALRQTMGEKGRKKILDSGMDWDSTAKQFDQIFRFVSGAGKQTDSAGATLH